MNTPAGEGWAALEQRLRVELRKAEAVRSLGRVLGATLDLDRLLERLLDKVTELLDAERASLFLVTSDGGLESSVAQGPRGTMLTPIRIPAGKGIAGWVASSGETVNIPDVYSDPRFDPSNDQKLGFRTRSMLCMPLPDRSGTTIGVIQVLNKRGGRAFSAFDSDDEALLQTVAAVAGINVENARLYAAVLEKNRELVDTQAELREKLNDLDLLYRIETETSAALDEGELIDRVLVRSAQIVGTIGSAITLDESATGRLRYSNHIDAPPRTKLSVPLTDAGNPDGGALGTLQLYDKHDGDFDESDRKLLTLIAGQAARSLSILRARDERARGARLQAVGQLVSGLLHDLKTPMTIASGYTQLMADSDDRAERSNYAAAVLKQFEILEAMNGEVLAFVRGKSRLLVRKVHVNQFTTDLRQQLQRELDGKSIELVIDAPFQGVAYFDELKLFRAIHNLTRNAAQAMPNGGRFSVGIAVSGDRLQLTFADQGDGIPDAMRGRLFTVFSTSGKAEGTGLGLAIVKKIVNEHGGTITCDSEAGRGTTFRIELPLQGPTVQGAVTS